MLVRDQSGVDGEMMRSASIGVEVPMRMSSRNLVMALTVLSTICYGPVLAQNNSPRDVPPRPRLWAPYCVPSDLDTFYQFSNEADAQQVAITFRNISSHTCTLQSGEGVAFGGHGHSIWTKECRNCEPDGTVKKVPSLEIGSGESGKMIVRWRTQASAGETCQQVGGMNGTAWSIWAISLLRDVCAVVYEDSYLPAPDNVQGQNLTNPSGSIETPVNIELTASDETFYTMDSLTLHVKIEDHDGGLQLKNDSCPLLFVRMRGADGATTLEEPFGTCRATPLANQPGRLISLDLETQSWGALMAPMDHSVQAFAVLGSPHARNVEMVASNVVHLKTLDPNTIPQTWSPESKGVAMSLSFDKATYPIGHDIPLRMAVENFSADADIISGELPCSAGFKFELRDSAGQLLTPSGGGFCTGHGAYAKYPKGTVVPVRGFTLRGLGLLPSEPGKYTLVATWEAQIANPDGPAEAPYWVRDGQPSPFKPYAIVRSYPVTFNIETER